MSCRVNQLVDAVYVLSVRTFEDRIEHCRAVLGEAGIDFEFIFDFDPPQLDDALLSQVFGQSTLGLPHKSLVLKHIHAWRMALQHGFERILVLEDDVVLLSDFCDGLKQAIEASALQGEATFVFLGGSDTKVPDWFFDSREVLKPLPNPTAEGYLIDAEAMRRRLAWIDANKISLPADHMMHRMDQETGVAQYWFHRALVAQGSVFGKFPTTLDASRAKHSQFYSFLRYWWQRMRRQSLRRLVRRLRP